MSEIINTLSETIPQGFENPSLLWSGLAVGVAGIAADFKKSSVDRRAVDNSLELADPEIAALVEKDRAHTYLRERGAFYAGVGAVAFGLLHLAQPYSDVQESTGSATFVIDGGYRADARDMADGQTRLQAAIDASLEVANERNMPAAFIVTGVTPRLVANLPAKNKKLDETRSAILKVLKDNSFRNGESVADGVIQAKGLDGEDINKIIVLSANPGSSKALPAIKGLQESKDTIYAVVTGKGEGEYSVGGQTLTSAADQKRFADILGPQHVKTATSKAEIVTQTQAIIDSTIIRKSRHESDLPGKTAVLFAAACIGMSGVRRLSGMFYNSKGTK